MATDQQYREFVCALDHAGLVALWEDVKAGRTPAAWPHGHWSRGRALEYLVLRGFELEGAEVTWPFQTPFADLLPDGSAEPMEQTDGVVYLDGLSCLVECKAEQTKVDVQPLAYLRNKLLRRPAGATGALVSLSGFTEAASTLACFMFPQTVLLWESDDIQLALDHMWFVDGMRAKYRKAVERGMPYYHLSEHFEAS
jgi:hypothetical protein